MNEIRLKMLIDQAEAMVADGVRKYTTASGTYGGPPLTALIEMARGFLEANGLVVADCRTETYVLLRYRPAHGDPIDEQITLDALLLPAERARSIAAACDAFKARHGFRPFVRDCVSVKFSASCPSASAE